MTGGGVAIFGLSTLILVAIFVALELLVRRAGWNTEITRRFAHVFACLYGVVVHALMPAWGFILLAVGFAGLMVLSRHFHVFTSVHKIKRRSLGDVYLPLGLAIAAAIASFSVENEAAVFVAAAMVLGWADVAAGVSGDLRGAEKKTWLGTAVFAAVAALVVAIVGFGVLPIAVVAVLGALTERYSSLGTDNLTVPTVVALVLVFF